jgi:DNA helicase HerA-like ATPase
MRQANSSADQISILRERYGADPKPLEDVLILAPSAKVNQRREEFPNVEVIPLSFASNELQASHWKFLMGAVGNQSMYLEQIKGVMKSQRNSLTLAGILQGVEQSTMPDRLKEIARTRLQFAADYIDDSHRLRDEIRPGRLVIVDLRDEFVEKNEALGLFVVLLQIISEATYQGQRFNKLVVFDEAHKYIESPDLTMGLIEVVREMRHKGTSILIASQDPLSVPNSLIELSSQLILHRFKSPSWLKHIQKSNAALADLTPERMSQLGTGEAYVWSMKATDTEFTNRAVKIRCRPRVTHHGGSTKTAVINS